MNRRESQNLLVAKHLKKHKSITWMEAYNKYGIVRCAARVNDLRKAGIKIASQLICHGEVKFSRYTLMKSE